MSTTEEQVALLNAEKQANDVVINNILLNKDGLEQAILDSYSSINTMSAQINQYQIDITALENDNVIIDDIIDIISNTV